MRIFLFFAVLAVALGGSTTLRAQVSDSERAAARQLFLEGDDLQRAGNPREALEKFRRAEKVFSAPTNLVHIAQCSLSLGMLVEASEAYRAALRITLPANPTKALTDAQTEAKTELPRLEDRIPKMKLEIAPASVQNPSVQLDGAPVNAALVGAALPVDPGAHTVTVGAAGFATSSQSVTFAEREVKTVSFVLTAASGATGNVVSGNNGTGAVGATDRIQPIDRPTPPEPAATTITTSGILLGAHVGLAIPTGSFTELHQPDGTFVRNLSIGDFAGPGAGFGIDAGFRFSKVYFGLVYEFAIFGAKAQPGSGTATQTVSAAARNHFVGPVIAYISSMNGLGAYLEAGFGYRSFTSAFHTEENATPSSDFRDESITWSGFEGTLGVGAFLNLSSWLRLVPKASLAAGSFSSHSVSCNGSGSLGCAAGSTFDESLPNPAGHLFFNVGVTGYYDVPLR